MTLMTLIAVLSRMSGAVKYRLPPLKVPYKCACRGGASGWVGGAVDGLS